ncbi:MAG: cytochrome c [Woeseiaceae bacterium]|nr:cytochrome c [Woeseiaceae bacterium]
MDSHTDGEIYWWIRYGIPSLEMPPLGDELSDSEIWTTINFVRGLRHGTPPEH